MNEYTGEKLIHGLLILVPLLARLRSSLKEEDRAASTYAVEDLAKGTISHLLNNQKVDFATWQDGLNQFVDEIRNCSTHEDVLVAFAKVKGIEPYYQGRYFDAYEVRTIKMARETQSAQQSAEGQGAPSAPAEDLL